MRKATNRSGNEERVKKEEVRERNGTQSKRISKECRIREKNKETRRKRGMEDGSESTRERRLGKKWSREE